MKFKVHLGGQAYNLYLGGSISNLCLAPLLVFLDIECFIDAYFVTNYWESPEAYWASDYGIDGFSSITFTSNWLADDCSTDIYPSYGYGACSNRIVETNVFLPPNDEAAWALSDASWLRYAALEGHSFGAVWLNLNSNGDISTWRLSGAFSPEQLDYCNTCSEHFSNLFGTNADGVYPWAYTSILKFTLVDGPTDLIPPPSGRNPFVNYGTLYFGYTGDVLEYIGYIYMDESEYVYSYSQADGYLQLDSDSCLHLSIPIN